MSIRSTILALAVSSFAAGCVAEDSTAEETGTETAALTSPFTCQNVPSGCACVGGLLIVPVNINVENDGGVLNDLELTLIEDSLNRVNILNGLDIANGLSIYNLNVLNIFNNDLGINVSDIQAKVCAVDLLGIQICK